MSLINILSMGLPNSHLLVFHQENVFKKCAKMAPLLEVYPLF